ncbi:fibrinogen C domain-containing protein 1-like isoform X1 [Dunckerocampus dactyliophorus]|uniref:fibrinogen C domain-containing protein 1-like isoform X1 n=2 Tax=Dunckerocampus dactyliophorus TaxID=161453 RepID=UPI00240715BE|nr:fibrinogen C domain-containing protein 1-like isoform X1 [Dunckerocampus dactyliophorus]
MQFKGQAQRMKVREFLVAMVLLTGPHVRLASGSDWSDVGHDEDVHPNTLREADVEGADLHQDNYEDADWHPSRVLEETPIDPHQEALLDTSGHDLPGHPGASAAAHCGEQSSDGHCRLRTTLPPVGEAQNRCPDMFRCSDDVSFWLHENQNRQEQVEEMRETMSELQEELRNHRHRVQVLEMQREESARPHWTFHQRLRPLEGRHNEARALLHVHAELLHELQAHVHNLSDGVRHVSASTGCTAKDAHAGRPLGLRDTLVPDRHHVSMCPSDCASLYLNGVRHSGVYIIVLSPGASAPVYCDMETEGGGWTVLQRRHDGLLSFNRAWSEYRDGFGEPRGEHWLGNQQLYLLSNQGHYSLRIDMQDWSHAHRHALYNNFRIEDEENQYRLHVSGFSGTVEDSFAWYHDQQGFSTPDTGNVCAEISHSGWWFHQCFYANLNGVYYKGGRYSLKAQNLLGPDGIIWFSWKDSDFYSLKAVSMMMRPHNFRSWVSP